MEAGTSGRSPLAEGDLVARAVVARDLLARNGLDGHLQRQLLAGVRGPGRSGSRRSGSSPAAIRGMVPSPEIVWVPPVSSKLTPTSVSSESPWFCTWTSISGEPRAADRRRAARIEGHVARLNGGLVERQAVGAAGRLLAAGDQREGRGDLERIEPALVGEEDAFGHRLVDALVLELGVDLRPRPLIEDVAGQEVLHVAGDRVHGLAAPLVAERRGDLVGDPGEGVAAQLKASSSSLCAPFSSSGVLSSSTRLARLSALPRSAFDLGLEAQRR